MAATSLKTARDRSSRRCSGGRRPARTCDPLLKWVLTGMAALILLLIAFFFVRLYVEAKPAFDQFGYFGFVFDSDWNVSKEIYGALPLLAGTLITSAIALLLGVPVAVAVAAVRHRAVPACGCGLPCPRSSSCSPPSPRSSTGSGASSCSSPSSSRSSSGSADTFSFLPLVGGPVAGPNLFIAGLILAIMIIPIVSAISREVIATVPPDHKEASLALGATRWEMIRMAVLPYSRAGHRGRVDARASAARSARRSPSTLVIGNAPTMAKDIFAQGYSLAAVIANEFGEAASDPIHRAALIAAGLVLFVLTLVVNGFARSYVNRAERAAAHGPEGDGGRHEREHRPRSRSRRGGALADRTARDRPAAR